MVDVFFTVDVEMWCDGWSNLDARFPAAFQSYVYGRTPSGELGLPYQLRLLSDHGLTGVFFVEALFATRFGILPLAEIVDLVKQAGHEVQLHLHTEWVDEACVDLLGTSGQRTKRQFLRQFDTHEQSQLIRIGLQLLRDAGAGEVNAFRAGSFSFNADTLAALADNDLPFDASYNATRFGPESGVSPGELLLDSRQIAAGIHEFPMAIFSDAAGRLRHAQLGACSFGEIESALWRAAEAGRQSFVVLSHNFELLNQGKNREDKIVVNRFRKLCAFLERHCDTFRSAGFVGLEPQPVKEKPAMLQVPWWHTAHRIAEQAWRRSYR